MLTAHASLETCKAERKILLAAAGVAAPALALAIIAGIVTAPRLRAQATAAQALANEDRPRFDVASVKPYSAGTPAGGPVIQPGGRLTITTSLYLLIALAYQPIQNHELSGAPEWTRTARYSIEAKAVGNPSNRQIWLMLQSLLADRFKLMVHREIQQQPVYALMLVKPGQLGPELHPHAAGTKCYDRDTDPAPPPPGPVPPCGLISFFRVDSTTARQVGVDVTMQNLGRNLTGGQDRFVLDRTGLSGTYDFNIQFENTPAPPPGTPPAAAPDPLGSPQITAVREQLGLKLVPQTGPVSVLVIDHVEEPTPN